MTPEAQRIAIAEVVGWKFIMYRGAEWCGEVPAPDGRVQHAKPPPDYLSDLNAMHEAEEVLTPAQLDDYFYHLQKVCRPAGYTYKSAICATASQRAEAFLRTFNLYTP